MTAADYLECVAAPNVEEFLADQASLRKAINAAVTLYHVIDYAHPSDTPEGKSAQQLLRQRCKVEFRDFAVLEDVANAGKHSRRFNGVNASDLKPGRAAAFDDGTYFDDGTSWAESLDTIGLERAREISDLSHVLGKALSYFRSLASAGDI